METEHKASGGDIQPIEDEFTISQLSWLRPSGWGNFIPIEELTDDELAESAASLRKPKERSEPMT
ncbi:hypothetical protein [Rhizobium sp. BK176]|uniref:hypothetical protein n=1 Tax=Rhizobium sp. BK176 TaxID=2587071 RepID=UPI00216A63D5|nr:hypothetical protein [Rhizobium sp. BK176]MCS4089630.1 hypothetical protein [Rhizobium sp. BK176]